MTLLPLLFSTFTACTPVAQSPTSGVVPTWDVPVEVEETDISTVLRVRWTNDAERRSWVAYRVEGEAWSTTPISEGAGEKEALLLGLLPNAEVEIRACQETDDGEQTTESQTVATGGLPAELPGVTATTFLPDELDAGYLYTPILRDTGTTLAILDDAGRYVWAYSLEGETSYRLAGLWTAGPCCTTRAASSGARG